MQPPPSAAGLPALDLGCLPGPVRSAITARTGTTPVSGYVYDPEVAVGRAQALRTALPSWAEVFYAVKANSYAPVVRALAPHVDGFEIASAHEASLASATGTPRRPVRMAAAGPGKSAPMLARLVELGVEVINVESPLELQRVNAAAQAAGRRVAVAIRVNPDRVEVAGSLQMGGAATQFGIAEAEVPATIALAHSLPCVDLVGFHVHAVSNNLDADSHAHYVRWCIDWATRTAHANGVDLQVIDVGGGIGVPFEGEDHFDLDRFGDRLGALRPPSGVRVVFEPGRFLVTECGYYAAEVTDVKTSAGTAFAIVRGGINHFQLPTSWDILHRFAVLPVDEWPHPYPRPELRDTAITVVGELCTPEDTLARDMVVSRVRPGDVIVFTMAGSYGYEFAMPNFLGHPPAERWLV